MCFWPIFLPFFLHILSVSGCLCLPLVCLQGPCTGNQQSLAHSRLWDAVVGFLHVFAHMMMKLAQVRVHTASTHTSNKYTFSTESRVLLILIHNLIQKFNLFHFIHSLRQMLCITICRKMSRLSMFPYFHLKSQQNHLTGGFQAEQTCTINFISLFTLFAHRSCSVLLIVIISTYELIW